MNNFERSTKRRRALPPFPHPPRPQPSHLLHAGMIQVSLSCRRRSCCMKKPIKGGGPWERVNLSYSSPTVWAGPDYQKPYACVRGRPVSIWRRNHSLPWVDSPFISRKIIEAPPKGTFVRTARDRVYKEEVQESPDYVSRTQWKGNRKLGEPLTPTLPLRHNKSFIQNMTEFGYQDIHMPSRGISTKFLRGLIFIKDSHKYSGIGIFNLSSGRQLSDFEGTGSYEVATLDRSRITAFGYARTKEMDYATLDEQPTRLDPKEMERPDWLIQTEKQFENDMPAYYKMIKVVEKRKRWEFWQYLQGFYRKNSKKLYHLRMSLCPLCENVLDLKMNRSNPKERRVYWYCDFENCTYKYYLKWNKTFRWSVPDIPSGLAKRDDMYYDSEDRPTALGGNLVIEDLDYLNQNLFVKKNCPNCGYKEAVHTRGSRAPKPGLINFYMCHDCGHTWNVTDKKSIFAEYAR
uniref:TFIIS-type domain-containing protein n=1 Tax=Lotharella oceanica TaxID=641309 RepID=A0A7S2TQ91_9EUKA